MEVRAQYPSSAALFSPNNPRKAPRLAGGGPSPLFGINDATVAAGRDALLPGAFLPQQPTFLNGAITVFNSHQGSGLTCNDAAGSRKRCALDGDLANTVLQANNLQQQEARVDRVSGEMAPVKAAAAPFCLQMSHNEVRSNDSATTSTSGRPPAGARVPATTATATAISPFMQQLLLRFYRQSLEIDAFIRLQNEKIRSGLEEVWIGRHRALMSLMNQGVLDRLREKEAELESASRRNAELEEKIRQMASENQIWFDVAQSKEAIASSLRATLEQVLLQNAVGVQGGAAVLAAHHQEGEEVFGETDFAASVVPAEDAHSCLHEGACTSEAGDDENGTAEARRVQSEVRLRSACKACGKGEASALLLPCRHLCLCKQCDAGVDTCPVCNAAKKTSLQVFMC